MGKRSDGRVVLMAERRDKEIRKERRSRMLRRIADLLTLLRFMAAAFVVVVAVVVGPTALKAAVIATLVGWVTDVADGPIARRSTLEGSWISRADFAADMSLAFSFYLFIVISGLFPVVPAIILAAAGGVVVMLKPTRLAVQMVAAPICALPVVLSFNAGLLVGITYFGLLAALVIFRWDRLAENAGDARREVTRKSENEV